MKLKYFLGYSALIGLVIVAAYVFNNKKQMSPVFLVPYFSGAANFELPNNWLFVEEEINIYKNLNSQEKTSYNFIANPSKATAYSYNSIGLVYLIMVANLIFPWLGDVSALEVLQVLMHIFVSICVINVYKNRLQKVLFLGLYTLNPLVIYLVTFPFYYFWQVLIPALLLPYLIDKNFRYGNWIFLSAFIAASAFLTRPTVAFSIVLFLLLYLLIEKRWQSLGFILLFVGLITLLSVKKTDNAQIYWHTVFIGVGAYPNSYVKTLSDYEGFGLFTRKTGMSITNTLPGGNLYYDKGVRMLYIKNVKEEFLRIASKEPQMILRNAILNFFQSFSLGYFVDYPLWVSYLSSLLGFILFTLLLLKRHFLWIAAIGLTSISFTPYYPPIQSYMFGSYILIVGAVIQLLNDFGFIQWLEEKLQQLKLKHFSLFKSA